MNIYEINHVKVEFIGFDSTSEEMAKSAIEYAENNKENEAYVISSIKVTKDGEEADFDVQYDDNDQPKFGRIRRITG